MSETVKLVLLTWAAIIIAAPYAAAATLLSWWAHQHDIIWVGVAATLAGLPVYGALVLGPAIDRVSKRIDR